MFNNNSLKIGFTALKYNEGFRPDGSYMYGRHLSSKSESFGYNFEDTLSRIKNEKGRFQPSRINNKAVIAFEELLKLCKSKNIEFYIFLPPYAHTVYEQLSTEKKKYPYIFELYNQLSPICMKYDFPLYDFSDLKKLGANDFETIDGFHGSETAYLKIMLQIFPPKQSNTNILNYSKALNYLKKPYSARQLENEVIESNSKAPIIKK